MECLTAVFVDGYLERTIPELEDYYEQREFINNSSFIISDGVKYDLEDINSISSVAVPKRFKPMTWEGMGVTGYLDYVLRMKASEVRRSNNNVLSIELLKKATEIMPYSSIGWSKKDYMRLVYWLYEDERFDEADLVKNKIGSKFSKPNFKNPEQDIKRFIDLGYDLTITNGFRGCCPECAKYRKRVYSISGKDKRFPKVPEPWYCNCQGIVFLQFIEGITRTDFFGCDDFVSYSNRPFIDDRTDEEKRIHLHYLDRLVYESVNERDRRNFNLIKHLLPDIAPKSMSAYSRMRNNNSEQYNRIVLKIKELDIDISLNEEERTAIDRYLKFKKETGWS